MTWEIQRFYLLMVSEPLVLVGTTWLEEEPSGQETVRERGGEAVGWLKKTAGEDWE
jgi:hypothetical protein